MPEVICLGEALIDFVASDSGVGVGESVGFLRAPGGAPANVAVGVARLGHSSALLSKVGDDPFGRFLEKTFSDAGVDTGGMVFDAQYRTGLAFVSLAANGERDFCFFRNPSADMKYRPDELDVNLIQSGRIFHSGSISLIDDLPRSTTLKAVEIARSAGLLISFDPNLRPSLWPNLKTARSQILSAAKFADVIKVSEEELHFLLSEGNEFPPADGSCQSLGEASCRLLAMFPELKLLVVTLGENGCEWYRPGEKAASLPGFKVKAVDTTGAGDAFVAAMLAGLLEHNLDRAGNWKDVEPAVFEQIFQLANAAGALTTVKKGAIPALATRIEAEQFLLNHGCIGLKDFTDI